METLILSLFLSKKKNHLFHLLDILLGLGGDSNSNASESDAELEEFLLEKLVPCNSNVIAWWNMSEHRFLKLAKLAKFHLGIPATSASSKIVFLSRHNNS